MYKSLILDSDKFKLYKNSLGKSTLDNLAKINIFVGPNNSGKSTFLRNIFSNVDGSYNLFDLDLGKFNREIESFKSKMSQIFGAYKVAGVPQYEESKLVKIDFLNSENLIILNSVFSLLEQLSTITVNNYHKLPNLILLGDIDLSGLSESIKREATVLLQNLKIMREKLKSVNSENKKEIYIPTLRGLRGANYQEGAYLGYDNYAHRTKDDYFKNVDIKEGSIYTGLELYNDVKKMLLGNKTSRGKIREFEKFIGETFFEGKDFSIIPSIEDNAVHISINNEEDKPIYLLGDGIQSIIILTYPLFFNSDSQLKVFYEEPDMYLHPGFQRIFIETISKPLFKKCQFFFTTHSNHFLDMTLDYSDISVYSFHKTEEKNFIYTNVESASSEVLQNLGVRNSSVFLSNCTIWVEGITDRIYIRKLLELIFAEQTKAYSEDIHFSFVEYGGNNITHWSFLDSEDDRATNVNVDKLCGKLFLITDSDNAADKSKKKERQEKLQLKLGDRYYCLKAKEIENLLTKDIILETVKSFEKVKNKGNINYKKGAKLEPHNKIGQFIDSKITGKEKVWQSDSGTIKSKVEFAKNAVEFITSFDDLIPEAKNLSQKLFSFIQSHNS